MLKNEMKWNKRDFYIEISYNGDDLIIADWFEKCSFNEHGLR